MKTYELIGILSSSEDEGFEDVLIEIDGTLYEISRDIGFQDEAFDGFDTAFPAAVVLRPVKTEEYAEFEEIINN